MIDFFISEKQLELVGAVCAAVLVVFPLLKLSVCGVKKQIGRLSLYAKILLGFCIVNSIIVCGTETNDPPRSAGATLTGKATTLAAENTAAKMAAFPVKLSAAENTADPRGRRSLTFAPSTTASNTPVSGVVHAVAEKSELSAQGIIGENFRKRRGKTAGGGH